MELVADKEQGNVQDILKSVSVGKIVIPANKNHLSLSAEGIGEGLRTKINVNLGISKDCQNIEAEVDKVKKAIRAWSSRYNGS